MRGLITQFKYAPFLPIRHHLLNAVYGVTAVTMNSMSISTIPDFPLCFTVDLRMKAFNHKVFLPPIEDFNEAIHWGKYRQYIGRGAQKLAHDIDIGFLTQDEEDNLAREEHIPGIWVDEAGETDSGAEDEGVPQHLADETYTYQGQGSTTFNRQKELLEGKHLQLYYPRSTPGRIFTADMANYRQQGEDLRSGRGKAVWEQLLGGLNIDINTNPQAVYDYQLSSTETSFSGGYDARTLLQEYLRIAGLTWSGMNGDELQKYEDIAVEDYKRNTNSDEISEETEQAVRNGVKTVWFAYMFNNWRGASIIQNEQETAITGDNLSTINEWEIPMDEFILDKSRIVLEATSVNITNNFATLQLQLHESPTRSI
jgi:hypothetical protein